MAVLNDKLGRATQRPWARGVAALVSLALAGAPLPAMSQTTGLEDLVYQSADYASRDLPRRGYVLARTDSRGSETWYYWSRPSDARCVRVSVKDDRVTGQGIVDPREWCNLGAPGSSGPSRPSTGIEDLVYQSSATAQRELSRRGYVLTHTNTRKNEAWQHWWRWSDSRCVLVSMKDDRVTGQGFVDETDCNQRPAQAPGSSGSSESSGMSDGAKVAIAAAAILGVAALAHKSHENSKDRAQQSPQNVADYERGYRDGLYHQGYHNYNNQREYSDGYNAGTQKRSEETRYRSNEGHHSGYAPYVNLNDLNGARGAGAETTLQSRGFRNTSGYKANDRAHTYWWNANTRQCVNVAVHDGRVESIQATGESYCQK